MVVAAKAVRHEGGQRGACPEWSGRMEELDHRGGSSHPRWEWSAKGLSGMVRPNSRAGLSCRLKPSAMRVVCERFVRNSPAEWIGWIIVSE